MFIDWINASLINIIMGEVVIVKYIGFIVGCVDQVCSYVRITSMKRRDFLRPRNNMKESCLPNT